MAGAPPFGNTSPFFVVGTPVSSGAQTFSGDKRWVNAVADQGTLATWTPAAYTGLTASTEAPDIDFSLNRTVQFATGALTLQRAAVFRAPTYSFVGASTISDAVTFCVDGPPVAGTNATLTKRWAAVFGTPGTTVASNQPMAVGMFGAGTTQIVLRNTTASVEMLVQASPTVTLVGSTTAHPLNFVVNNNTRAAMDSNGKWTVSPTLSSSGVTADWVLTPGANTGITASTESNVFRIATATRTWATTGTVATQRDFLFNALTYASASASQTFTDAATVAISGAPIAGSNAVITRGWALYVQGGDVCLAGSGSALATNATTGFTWLPSCAGTPTGAPSQKTGTSAIVVDTTGSKIWVLIGGVWKGVAVA